MEHHGGIEDRHRGRRLLRRLRNRACGDCSGRGDTALGGGPGLDCRWRSPRPHRDPHRRAAPHAVRILRHPGASCGPHLCGWARRSSSAVRCNRRHRPGRARIVDADMVDLGEHSLKGLAGPQRLFQLTVDGLAAEFGPLRTEDVWPTLSAGTFLLTDLVGWSRVLLMLGDQGSAALMADYQRRSARRFGPSRRHPRTGRQRGPDISLCSSRRRHCRYRHASPESRGLRLGLRASRSPCPASFTPVTGLEVRAAPEAGRHRHVSDFGTWRTSFKPDRSCVSTAAGSAALLDGDRHSHHASAPRHPARSSSADRDEVDRRSTSSPAGD